MQTNSSSFLIQPTASRITKGLLIVPSRFSSEFPNERGEILVKFDDGEELESKYYLPDDRSVKERRIYGMGSWFALRQVAVGDNIRITVEDKERKIYRILLERYVVEKQASESRQRLLLAEYADDAVKELDVLAQLGRKRTRAVALEEVQRLAIEMQSTPRRRAVVLSSDRREHIPEGIRVLLEAVHNGKCQMCSFTFTKRDGKPYFEVHHLDPERDHHPANLLVVCPNCHAQLEHGVVSDCELVRGWLVAVKVNGKRMAIRQPFVHVNFLGNVLRLVFFFTRISSIGVG